MGVNPEVISVGLKKRVVVMGKHAPTFGNYVRYESSRDLCLMVFEPDGMPGVHGRAEAQYCFMLKGDEEAEIRAEYARQVEAFKEELRRGNQASEVSAVG
jgi:hypothetical protein